MGYILFQQKSLGLCELILVHKSLGLSDIHIIATSGFEIISTGCHTSSEKLIDLGSVLDLPVFYFSTNRGLIISRCSPLFLHTDVILVLMINGLLERQSVAKYHTCQSVVQLYQLIPIN